jgi:hypothetical protein
MSKYQQDVRDAIYLRENERKPIYEIADLVEKIVREQVAQEIEGYIEPDHEARAFTYSADLARRGRR